MQDLIDKIQAGIITTERGFSFNDEPEFTNEEKGLIYERTMGYSGKSLKWKRRRNKRGIKASYGDSSSMLRVLGCCICKG